MSIFRTVELDIVRPATVSETEDTPPGHGVLPYGTLSRDAQAVEFVETLRFSDAGYVDQNSLPYPPYVSDAFEIDRGLTLLADALGGSRSFGSITLSNPSGVLDSMVLTRVNDHLPVRIFAGRKSHDAARGLDVDPPMGVLSPVFAGLGKNWQPGRRTITIELLDATWWLESSMVVGTYGGSGKLDGDSNVAGRNMPRIRGTVRNITPVLIDSVNYVYQISDGPAVISALYEGGYAGGIQSAGSVADLYAASPAPGTYTYTSSASGTFFRLGTKPVYAITVDATGSFRSGKVPVNILDILRQVLFEDLAMPAAYLDPAWPELSPLAPWPGGWYWDGSEAITGSDAVTTLLSGLGITIVPTRTGTLLPVILAVPERSGTPKASLSADLITEIEPVALDASLDPPTWRWRIGWQHNFTVQEAGSTLHPQIPAEQQSFAAQSDRNAVWYSQDIKAKWRLPNDPTPVVTALSRQQDAQEIANRHGALWGTRRRVWSISVPQDRAWLLDLGDPVWLSGPAPGLTGGAPGVVVGEQIRSAESVVTFRILV